MNAFMPCNDCRHASSGKLACAYTGSHTISTGRQYCNCWQMHKILWRVTMPCRQLPRPNSLVQLVGLTSLPQPPHRDLLHCYLSHVIITCSSNR
jgi:hypothetical protein